MLRLSLALRRITPLTHLQPARHTQQALVIPLSPSPSLSRCSACRGMSHHNPGPTLPSSSAPTRERSHSPFKSSKRRKTSIQAHPGIVRDQEARKDENGESMAEPLPTITLTPLEATLRDLLLDVVEYINARKASQSPRAGRAPAEGLVLRFTGGWVRDKLLGVQSKDIDVGISSMTGLQFGLALKEYLDTPGNLDKYKKREGISGLGEDRIVSLHKISANPEKSKHLETVTTKIFGLDVDLVNLRKETYTEDSRNPQMEFGTPYEDAMRRDATVNAMFYNLNTASVEDFTGAGLQDMRERLIRTPLEPHQTFKDDPLRVLRLIRFSSRLGYKIDEETAEAMGMADIKEALKVKISPERVGVEVQKTLRGPDPLKALRFIDQHNLYNMIFINHADPIEADTSTWARVYESLRDLLNDEVDSISAPGSTIPLATRQFLRNHLVRADTENELYYAWLLAALAPWAVVPLRDAKGNVVPPTIKRPPQARVVAGQGMRFDNKTLTVIGDAATAWSGVQEMVGEVVHGGLEKGMAGPEFRERLGLFMRGLGQEWRMSLLLAMLLECTVKDRGEVFLAYTTFLETLERLSLIDIHLLKPIVNGHELAAALGVSPGFWMAKALAEVVNWQLRNPETTDKEKAIEEVRAKREVIGWDAAPPAGEKKGKGKGKKA